MGIQATEPSGRSHRQIQTPLGRLGPARALEIVRHDPELQAVNETLKRDYPEHLVNLDGANVKLSRLKAQVLNHWPYSQRRAYLTGPKFERAVLDVLTTQNRIDEFKTFAFRALNGETHTIRRVDLLWLKQHFRFSNAEVATYLNCNVRHVARMSQKLEAHGLQFRHSRSSSRRPASFGPLPKKPQFDRSLTPDEHAWIKDVRSGRLTIRLNGQMVTGPEAARQLKYMLHRDKDKAQYDAWVDKQRLVGHNAGSELYEPDWMPHPGGKALPNKRTKTSPPIEDEEESKALAYLAGIDKSKPSSTYQPKPRREP